MLDVMKFILKVIAEFIAMLFEIDLGFTSLGTLMCVCFIFLPTALTVINFIKRSFADEYDDFYDSRMERKIRYHGKHEKK